MFHDNGIEAIATIEGIKKNFTSRDIAQAEVLHQFQHVVGHMSETTLHYVVTTHRIKNMPIIGQNVKLMNNVLGKYCIVLRARQ